MRRRGIAWNPPPRSPAFVAARRAVRSALVGGPPTAPGLLERLGEPLGLPLQLLGIDPVAAESSAAAVAPLARGWCVHLRTAAGRSLDLRLDDALAAGLAAEVFGVESWTLPADGGGEPVAGVLAALALRALDTLAAAGRPLELVDLHRIATTGNETGRVRVSLRLLAGGKVGRAEVAVRPEDAAAESPPRAAWVATVPVELLAACARGRLRWAELLALRPGDAVTFDEWAAGEGEAPLRTAWLEPRGAGTRGPRWPAHADDAGRWTIAGPPRAADHGRTEMTTDGADRTEVNLETGDGSAALDAVPIEVTAVAGRATLTVGALAALQSGDVVTLGRSTGGTVDLLAHGLPFARGRLVDLDGELAVELTELRAAPTAPPGGTPGA
ncbi:MAG: FliM/FliN family flagellar motor switch protein [Deltaproteobacteria bacterium]|nr:FliM/FliN family flagellar motor switch protein [Deltaproteobacteria bacterium]